MKTQKFHLKVGRPSVVLNKEVVRKLELAFQNGMSDRTACCYAKIGHTAFYKALKENEQFADRIASAKNFLKLLAGKRLVQILKDGDDKDATPLVKFILKKLEPEKFGKNSGVVMSQNFQYVDPDWFILPTEIMSLHNKNQGDDKLVETKAIANQLA